MIRLIGYIFSALVIGGLSLSYFTQRLSRVDQLASLLMAIFVVGSLIKLLSPFKESTPHPTARFAGLPYFLTVTIILVVLGRIIFSPATNVGHDSNLLSQGVLTSIPLMPQTWESTIGGVDLGHNQIISMWQQPVLIGLSLLGRIGFTYPWLIKLLVVGQVLVGVYGVFKLLAFFGSPTSSLVVAAIFYFANTYYLTSLDGGLIFLTSAYSLFPLATYLGLGRIKFCLTTLVLILASYLDLRILPLMALVWGLWLLVTKSFKSVWILLIVFLTAALGHAFWLIPALHSANVPLSSLAVGSPAQFSFYSFGHLLFFSQPHWYSNIFGHTQPPVWYLFGLPLIFLIPIFFAPATRSLKFGLALLVLGFGLTGGTSGFFGTGYQFLYDHLPGFMVFRDPSKFNFLIFLGALILIPSIIGQTSKIFALALGVYLIFIAHPAYLGLMGGSFYHRPYEAIYSKLAHTLEADSAFSRLLWMPSKPPLGSILPNQLWTDALALLTKRPFQTQVVGVYDYLNYLRTPGSLDLLAAVGVKYLAFPQPDLVSQRPSPDELQYYFWQNTWLASQPQLTQISNLPLPAYQLAQAQDHIYAVDRLLWVTGPDDTYSNFSLTQTGVVHLANFAPSLDLIQSTDILVFNRTSPLDLVLGQIPHGQLNSFGRQILPSGNDSTGWWSRTSVDYLSVKDYLFTRYNIVNHDHDLGQGYALSEGEHTLTIATGAQAGTLYLRALASTAGGELALTRPGPAQFLNTTSSDNVFVWYKAGTVGKNTQVTITASGDLNVLNAWVVLSGDDFLQLSDRAFTALAKTPSVRLGEGSPLDLTSSPHPTIAYTAISPTSYTFTTTHPGWIVFAESYDPQWLMDDSVSPVPVHDMLNGYYVTTPGVHTLIFQPQKYVLLGVLITSLALVSLVTIIIITCIKK